MTDNNEDLGTIERDGDHFVAELTREVEHPPAAMWAMLTDPDKLVEWLAPGNIELREGGQARLNFTDSGMVIDSTVTSFEPEQVIEYSWSGPGECHGRRVPLDDDLAHTFRRRYCAILCWLRGSSDDVARRLGRRVHQVSVRTLPGNARGVQ